MANLSKPNREARRAQEQAKLVAQQLHEMGQSAIVVEQSEQHISSGPIPTPDILAEYDRVMPGLANRIMTMAEAESDHRRTMEAKVVDVQAANLSRYRDEISRGQRFALIIAMTIAVGSILLIYTGHSVTGSLLCGTTLVSLVTAFLAGRGRPDTPFSEGTKQIPAPVQPVSEIEKNQPVPAKLPDALE